MGSKTSKSSVTKRDKKLVAAKRALDKKGTASPKPKRRLLVRTREEQDSHDAESLHPNTGCELKQNNIESDFLARLTEKETNL